MNYIEVSRAQWHAVLAECPVFVRRRIEALVKSGYLTPAGGGGLRTSYRVTGGPDEYAVASDIILKAAI